MVSGQKFTWGLSGSATHNGGSCQVGVSYDLMATNVVLASYIGGCPLAINYTLTLPQLPASSKALFFWSWVNESGNREYYQNCAVVAITGTASTIVGPEAYKANLGTCTNTEGIDDVYPNPGDQVFYGGKYASAKPKAPISFAGACTFNNDIVVTASAGGGKTGAGAAPSIASGVAGQGSAAASAGSAGSSVASSTGSPNAAQLPSATAGQATPPAQPLNTGGSSPTIQAQSASSTTTTNSLIPGIPNATVFIGFGLALSILIAVMVFLLCQTHRRQTGGQNYQDLGDDDTSEEDSDREKHGGRRKR